MSHKNGGSKDGIIVPGCIQVSEGDFWEPGELYRTAVKIGEQEPMQAGPTLSAVRFAARSTAYALLDEAKRIGLSEGQWEALREVAARVACDNV